MDSYNTYPQQPPQPPKQPPQPKMTKCPKCHRMVLKGEQYCPYCGAELKRFYEKLWFTILLLICIPPLGIFFLWYYQRKRLNKIVLIALTVLFVAYTPAWFSSTLSTISEDVSNYQEEQIQEQRKPIVYDACSSVGLEQVDCFVSEMTDTHAIVKYSGKEFDVNIKDDVVTDIYFEDVYFMKDKEVLNRIPDLVITNSEMNFIEDATQEYISSTLKAPSTAKYGDFVFNQNKRLYSVKGWVEAENVFGTPIRHQFVIYFDWDGDKEHEPQLQTFQYLDE